MYVPAKCLWNLLGIPPVRRSKKRKEKYTVKGHTSRLRECTHT